MFEELHMIQNFAPSCLNRDDTNSPKDCEFGGYRRARISSQCLKRAIRKEFKDNNLIDPGYMAVRTKLLVSSVSNILIGKGRDEEEAKMVVRAALEGLKITTDADDKTQYLMFVASNEIQAIADVCDNHWEDLLKISMEEDDTEGKTSKQKKKQKRAAIPSQIQNELKKVWKDGKATDLAFFGRMFADNPNFNVDGASQVAHAISTHRVSMDMDFFTAVDDLQTEEDQGAGMMGTVGFNSSCFYRYSTIDTGQLMKNLGKDKDLALSSIDGFLRASVTAIPTGKQNSMAAHNPPSLIMVVVKSSGQPWSLANAFASPVRPDYTGKNDLISQSIDRLLNYQNDMVNLYGDKNVELIAVNLVGQEKSDSIKGTMKKFDTFENLITTVREKIHDGIADQA